MWNHHPHISRYPPPSPFGSQACFCPWSVWKWLVCSSIPPKKCAKISLLILVVFDACPTHLVRVWCKNWLENSVHWRCDVLNLFIVRGFGWFCVVFLQYQRKYHHSGDWVTATKTKFHFVRLTSLTSTALTLLFCFSLCDWFLWHKGSLCESSIVL